MTPRRSRRDISTPASCRRSAAWAPSRATAHRTARPPRLWRPAPAARSRPPERVGRASAVPSRQKRMLPCSLAGPPHCDALHPQRRLADADRHALAVLAAGADAGIELKIVADHGDAMQVGRAVADQHRALQRRADPAVLDLVGF